MIQYISNFLNQISLWEKNMTFMSRDFTRERNYCMQMVIEDVPLITMESTCFNWLTKLVKSIKLISGS